MASLTLMIEYRRITAHTRAFLSDKMDRTDSTGNLQDVNKSKKPKDVASSREPSPTRQSKERPTPSRNRFSVRKLLRRVWTGLMTAGWAPREEMPDLILLWAGILVPVIPALFKIGDYRIAYAVQAFHTFAMCVILFSHVMLVAPKRSEAESVHPKGLFESKMLALGARALGYTWIGTAIGAASAMLRMNKHGPGRLVATVLATAIGDTMGYFVGRAFGRRKAVPGLSPNKTVEGLMGHIFLAPLPLIVGANLDHILGSWSTDWMPYAMKSSTLWVALFGSLIAAIGAVGDLAESFIKRAAAVKDSGDVFAGHGGLLDRLDSHLLTIPVSYYMMLLLDVLRPGPK